MDKITYIRAKREYNKRKLVNVIAVISLVIGGLSLVYTL